jgi:hypothetical protein
VEILHRQQFRATLCEPLGARQRLALGTMAVAAGNGELSITCVMVSLS